MSQPEVAMLLRFNETKNNDKSLTPICQMEMQRPNRAMAHTYLPTSQHLFCESSCLSNHAPFQAWEKSMIRINWMIINRN